METVLKAIADWIKGILTAGIMSNLSGLFDDVNTQVGNIAQQVGTKPSNFEPRVFAMIEALSRNVVLPIAGIILTFIACYELIEMITQHNNGAVRACPHHALDFQNGGVGVAHQQYFRHCDGGL